MVYRGINSDFFASKKSGIYNKTTQFNSTSLDVLLAKSFAEETADGTLCCMLQITLLKGSRVLYINSISN